MTDTKMDEIHLGDDDNSINDEMNDESPANAADDQPAANDAFNEDTAVEAAKTETPVEGSSQLEELEEEAESHKTNEAAPQTSQEEQSRPTSSTKAVATPAGKKVTVNETTFYETGMTEECETLVVVLTNYLGFQSNNNMLLADAVHESTQLPVVLLDSTGNNPAMHVMRLKGDEELPHLPPPQNKPKSQSGPSFLGKFKSWFAGSVSGFFDDMWLAAHSYEKTIEVVRASLEDIYLARSPKKIIVVGYGFGARYVLPLLRKSSLFNPHEADDEESDPWEVRDKTNAGDYIISGIAINPSLITLEDFKQVYKPLLFIYSDDNELLPRKLIEEGFRLIPGSDAERKLITQDPPLPHGFAVPGDYSSDVVGSKPQEVLDLIGKWVKK